MKRILSPTTLMLLAVLGVSCVNDTIPAAIKSDYTVIGELGSFRINPDVLLKVQGGRVYTTNRQMVIDVSAPPAYTLLAASDSLLNAIRGVASSIPVQLLQESSETLGGPVPDVGHLYVEVKVDGLVRHWYIEAQPPSYLTSFVSNAIQVINKASN